MGTFRWSLAVSAGLTRWTKNMAPAAGFILMVAMACVTWDIVSGLIEEFLLVMLLSSSDHLHCSTVSHPAEDRPKEENQQSTHSCAQ